MVSGGRASLDGSWVWGNGGDGGRWGGDGEDGEDGTNGFEVVERVL